MTLRSAGRDTVPMMGPRAVAVAAPQVTGKRALPAGWGWEVRRICSARLISFIGSESRWCLGPDIGSNKRRDSVLVPRGDDVPLNISVGRHQSNDTTFACVMRAGAPVVKCFA